MGLTAPLPPVKQPVTIRRMEAVLRLAAAVERFAKRREEIRDDEHEAAQDGSAGGA